MHRTLGGVCRRSTGAMMDKDAIARCDRLGACRPPFAACSSLLDAFNL